MSKRKHLIDEIKIFLESGVGMIFRQSSATKDKININL